MRLLAIGTSVQIDERSEHYPGATVTIVDVCNDPDYRYCVSPSTTRASADVVNAQWVRAIHVQPRDPWLVKRSARAKRSARPATVTRASRSAPAGPTAAPSRPARAPHRHRIVPYEYLTSKTAKGAFGGRRDAHEIAVGDQVSCSLLPFGPRHGYIVAIEPGEGGRVAIAGRKTTDPARIGIWVARRLLVPIT